MKLNASAFLSRTNARLIRACYPEQAVFERSSHCCKRIAAHAIPATSQNKRIPWKLRWNRKICGLFAACCVDNDTVTTQTSRLSHTTQVTNSPSRLHPTPQRFSKRFQLVSLMLQQPRDTSLKHHSPLKQASAAVFVLLHLCPNVCSAFPPSAHPRLVSTPLPQRLACGFRLGFRWPRYCRWYQRFVCCEASQRRPLFPLVAQPHREQHQRVRATPPSCAAKL